MSISVILAKFYQEESRLSFNGEVFEGGTAIMEKLTPLDFKHHVTTGDVLQHGDSDAYLILVTGTLSTDTKVCMQSYWTRSVEQFGPLLSPPKGPLQLRMLLSADDEDETWVVPVNSIPENWKAGDTYDSGIQVDDTYDSGIQVDA